MKVYIFGGSKENPNWYYTECKIDSKPFVGWDKEPVLGWRSRHHYRRNRHSVCHFYYHHGKAR